MSTFAPAPALASITPLDPSKHVNFTRGMVLGVADFKQEFAYLSGTDHRIVRDLIGYGVVSGLRLSVDAPPAGSEVKGPRLTVSPGEAVVPSGRLVCVSPAQCAFLGEWINSHADELDEDADSVSAFVVLSFAECETDDVPVPGEPCRDDESLMAPSRVKDHFALELRLEPPEQRDEDAVRWLAKWLAAVPSAEEGDDLPAFLAALREAAPDAGADPPEPAEPLPPPGLAIPEDRVSEYLQEAFALWTRELRARWKVQVPGCECAPGLTCPPADDVLLLGEVRVPATFDPLTRTWQPADFDELSVDLKRRPTLVHLRLLQEWLLAKERALLLGGTPRSRVFRAVVRTANTPMEIVGDDIEVFELDDGIYFVAHEEFEESAAFAVTGTALAGGVPDSSASVVFEWLDPLDPELKQRVSIKKITRPGVIVRAYAADGSGRARGFSIWIEQIGGAR